MQAVLKEKKLDYLEAKFVEASKGKNNTIQVAIELGKVSNDFNTIALKQDNFSQANNDPKVHGAIIGINEINKITKPIKGENGVYIAMVTEVNEPAVPEDLDGKKQFVNMMLFQILETKVVNSLKQLSEIKDNRGNFF